MKSQFLKSLFIILIALTVVNCAGRRAKPSTANFKSNNGDQINPDDIRDILDEKADRDELDAEERAALQNQVGQPPVSALDPSQPPSKVGEQPAPPPAAQTPAPCPAATAARLSGRSPRGQLPVAKLCARAIRRRTPKPVGPLGA